MKKVVIKTLTYLFVLLFTLFLFEPCLAASTFSITGKALVLNTDNSYLDFTSTYNANVTVNNSTGNFSGYAFLEDMGWCDFGSTDNPSGPVNLNLSTGAVTGKAYVINTGAYIDFTNYSSNVTVSFSDGAFSGYGFSEDAGWLDFSDTGVSLSDPGPAISSLSCWQESSHTTSVAENISQSDGQVSFTWTDLRPQTGDYFYYEYNQTENNSITGDESYTTDAYKNDVLLREGTWYFHVRPRIGSTGAWGAEQIFTIIYDGSSLSKLAPTLRLPDDKAYLNNTQPEFVFKKGNNPLSGIDHYELIIDGGRAASFVFDNIPSQHTSDGNKSSQANTFENDKIWVYYENWQDNNENNDYIKVRTLEKDKKLKQGERKWTVKAIDSIGNSRESSRILNIDLTKPEISLQKLGVLNFNLLYTSWFYTNQKPKLSGEITDPLAGEKIAEDNQKKVHSGPAKLQVEILQKTFWGTYKSYVLSASEIKDKKGEEKADFFYQPEIPLEIGQYKVVLSAFDHAGNQSETFSFDLKITLSDQEEIKEIIKEIEKEEEIEISEEEKQEIIKDMEIGGPEKKKENILKRLLGFMVSLSQKAYWTGVGVSKSIAGAGARLVKISSHASANLVKTVVYTSVNLTRSALEIRTKHIEKNKQKITKLASAFGKNYHQLMEKTSGRTKEILLSGEVFTINLQKKGQYLAFEIQKKTKSTSDFAGEKIADSSKQIGYVFRTSKDLLAEKTSPTTEKIKITGSFLASVWLDKEPTKIANVKVEEIVSDYAIITWETNHYATSKVNYGLTYDYGQDIQSDKRVKKHRIKITGLKPGTNYCYEVMSQNKNYVFDARHEFVTLSE